MTRNCPACGGANVLPWKARNLDGPVRPLDLSITDARYGTTLALSRCNDCRFVFADDPDVERLDELYAALDDPAYIQDDSHRTLQMGFLCDIARRERPNAATWLDVGAATGLLVGEAERRGFAAVGVEPSAALAAVGRERGLDIRQGTLPHPGLAERRFDIVSLIDVVEHVKEPVVFCRSAARHLSDGGLLIVVTPDVSSVAARVLGRKWWHFRVAHVGYFAPRSFARAAARAGLRVVRSERARWYFPMQYLMERVASYVPIGNLVEKLSRVRAMAPLLRLVVPLNLFDSHVYLLEKSAEAGQ
jgi:2-polyprenyl-3-methyl-5-hydroxy-6-metoxy-1,4-benzoquinol methylase